MTDNVEQASEPSSAETPAETSAETPTAAVKKQDTGKQPKKSRSLIAILALILVILALIAIGAIAWKGYELSQQVASVKHGLQKNAQSEAGTGQKITRLEKQLRLQASQIQQNGARLAQLPGADRNDWLLAEVEYLLRLANQRLNLESDVKGSLAIMAAADKVLAETENPLLLPVRQLLVSEIQTLKAVPAVDTSGAVARLQAVQDQIAQLEWMPRTLVEETAKVEPIAQGEVSAWQKFLDKALAGIAVVVRIREHEKALPAPLTPDQQYYLQQNMHLMLEQAQVALVRQQSDLYQQSIKRTQAWLDEFVMLDNDHAKAVKNTLSELQTCNVAPQLPVISGSLNKLRQLLEQQRRNGIASSQTSVN